MNKAAAGKDIVRVIRSRLPFKHYRVFYFGSRAAGTATERSDFDVGIDAGQKIPLELRAQIREDLDELSLLQKIDLVDFSSVSEEFRRRALEHAEIIYEQ